MNVVTDNGPARITRVVTLPIREVISADNLTVLDAFRRAWRLSTDLANWAQRELCRRDVRRTPDMERLPRFDRAEVYGTVPRTSNRKAKGANPGGKVGDPQTGSLYRLFTDTYPDRPLWDGAAASARDVLTAVEKAWTNHPRFGRFAVLWRGEARPMVFGYPYPYPVPADKGATLRLLRCEPERPHASTPLPGAADGRVLLRLADGREFRRQLRQFDVLLADPARLRQAKVTGRRAGGRLVGADLRLVGLFDKAEGVTGVTATVRTGPDALLTGFVAGEEDAEPIRVHFDHLRALRVAHDRWAYRLRQDGKLSRNGATTNPRYGGGSMIRARFDRAAARSKAEAQQAASEFVGRLLRLGVSDVVYDDSDRTYHARDDGSPGLDFTQLRTAVSCECEERGISFQHVAGVDDAA